MVVITVQDRAVEIRALTVVPAPRYPDGSKVGVVYYAGRPHEGSLEPELRSPWGPLLGVPFGSVLLGSAILIFRVFR